MKQYKRKFKYVQGKGQCFLRQTCEHSTRTRHEPRRLSLVSFKLTAERCQSIRNDYVICVSQMIIILHTEKRLSNVTIKVTLNNKFSKLVII